MLRSSSGRPSSGLEEAGDELQRQENDAEGDERLRNPDRRAARYRGLAAASKLRQVKLTIDQARKPREARAQRPPAPISSRRRVGRRDTRQHQRDPDVAAGAQRHRGAEGEGRGHQVGAVLPGDRDVGRQPRERRSTARAPSTSPASGSVSAARQRGAEPAVEAAEPVDEIEHLPQRRRRRCLARRDPGLVHELRFISAR